MQHEGTLSTIEVAHDLGLGRATVHRWIQDGTIPAIKVGRNYRIPLEPYLKFKASYVQTEDTQAPELHQLIDEWLNHLRNGARPFSPKTVDDYAYNFRHYVRMIGGGSSVSQVITRENARKAIESIPISGYARRCHLINSATSFAKFLVSRDLLPASIITELKSVRPTRFYPPKKTVLEADQVPEFLSAIWTASGNSFYQRKLNYALVKCMMLTGLRSSELCNLTLADVDLEKRTITVLMGKNRKNRVLGINQELGKILTDYKAIRPRSEYYSFFLSERGTPLRPNYLVYRIRRICKAIGLDVTPHSLRRYFITQSALKGHPLPIISRAVGHTDLKVTQAYLMIDQKQVIAEMQAWQ